MMGAPPPVPPVPFGAAVDACLGQPAPAGTHRYLMLDAAAFDAPGLRQARLLGDSWFDLMTHEAPDAEAASPLLMPMPDQVASAAWRYRWQVFAQAWRHASALSYLESELAPADLAHALHRRLDAVLPQELPVVLRYFDPRIAPVLAQVLTPEQRGWLFAPAQRWLVCDRHGDALALELPPGAPGEDATAPLRLTDAQEAALLAAAEPDAVIGALHAQQYAPLLELAPGAQHRHIAGFVAQGRTLGVVETTDLIAYCAIALVLEADFARHEPWPSALADVRAGRRSFACAAAEIAEGPA